MSVVGLGTDIVEISRFSEYSDILRLAKRVLTEAELKSFERHTMPERFLAKRFAAKEAAVKAIGTGIGHGVSWQQIEISNDSLGKPLLSFSDGALSKVQALGVNKILLTIADEQHYAVATVILSE
jgi:holo-[acyl-carrier protein] synthase